jgi:hypothetical protein
MLDQLIASAGQEFNSACRACPGYEGAIFEPGS